jgi:hypothetical protein
MDMVKQKSIAFFIVGLMLVSAFAGLTTAVPESRGTPDNIDSEPNDTYPTATNITLNTVNIGGTLNGADATDVYKIWLTNTGGNADTITVQSDYNTSNGIGIEITDAGGFQYYMGFDNKADNVVLKVVCGYSELFYINLTKQFSDVSYTLSVTKTNGAYQGNANNYPTQAIVSTGDNTPVTNTLEQTTPKDLQDFYKVAVSSTVSAADLVVVFLKQPTGADYWLQLYKPGSGITYTMIKGVKGSQPGVNLTLSYGAIATGDVYLRVYASTGAGAYTIYIQKTSIKKDASNGFGSAIAITLTSQHTWAVQDEVGESIDMEDWYSLSISKGQYLNVTINSIDYNPTSKLPMIFVSLIRADHVSEYFDANQTKGQADPIGYTNGTTPDPSGTNYIRVYVQGGGGGGRYNISLLTDKPPVMQSGQTSSIVVTENSYNNTINVHDVFSDPDTSDVLVYSFEKGTGSSGYKDNTNVSITIGTDGKLNITPKAGIPRGWTGSGALTLKARDHYGLNATITFTVTVKGTNHAPYVKAPYDATLAIANPVLLTYGDVERNATLDLRSMFGDNDTSDTINFDINVDNVLWINKETQTVLGKDILRAVTINDSIRISFTFEANLITHKGPIDISITDTAKAAKLNHDAQVYLSAIDNGDPVMKSVGIKLLIKVRKPTGNAPQWKATLTKVQFAEDNTTTVNFDDYIIDSDSADQSAIQYDVSNYNSNITVTQKDRNHYAFSAKPDWSGQLFGVKVRATDTFGLMANTTIEILVTSVPDAPTENTTGTNPSPSSPVSVDEGKSVELTVGVSDPDSLQTDLIYEWKVDGTAIPLAINWTYQYKPNFDAAGQHTITVKVTDNEVTSYTFTVTWNVTVNNVNRAPTGIKIVSPTNDQGFKQGAKIALNAQTASDPDKDPLTYTWYADNQPLPGGTGQAFTYSKLKAGTHKIKLVVSDGKLSIQSEVNIKIKKNAPKGVLPGFEGPMLFVTLVAVAVVLLRTRR